MRAVPAMSLLLLALLMVFGNSTVYGAEKRVPCNDPRLVLAPYVWKCTGMDADARAEATMPGAYLKTIAKGTKTIGLVIDGNANNGCPAASMPVVECSVDDGPFHVTQLARTGEVYVLPIAQNLDPLVAHKLEVYFRAADLTQKRWTTTATHLRIAGVALDENGDVTAPPLRPARAIGFGDSITEGVGVDGLFSSWQLLGVNNARCSWFPIVCAALNCEYGQLGSGGQGMVRELEMPPLPKIWDHYDAATSRLTNGLLLPEPDYVFCSMGTNDYGGIDITGAYIDWMSAVRRACPHARIFCVVPPSGVHRNEVKAAVAARNRAQDSNVYVIDIPWLNSTLRARVGATQMAYDGVHPSMYGSAVFGACVAVQAQELSNR